MRYRDIVRRLGWIMIAWFGPFGRLDRLLNSQAYRFMVKVSIVYKKRQVLADICTVWAKRNRVMYLFKLIGQKEAANVWTLYTLCMYIVCWHRGCYTHTRPCECAVRRDDL